MTGHPVPRRAALALLAAPMLMGQAPVPIFLPGSFIGIVPPPGMVPAQRFAGFEDAAMGNSIVLTEFPAEAYPDLEHSRDAMPRDADGFVVTQRKNTQVGGTEATLLKGTQVIYGIEHQKWAMIARPPGFLALVTAQVPPSSIEAYPAAVIEAALATVVFRTPGADDGPLFMLPFAIDDFAGFRLVRAQVHTAWGSIAQFTEGPLNSNVGRDFQQPWLAALWHRLPMAVPPEERSSYPRRALHDLGLRDPRDPEAGEVESVAAAGGDWLVLEATGGKDGGGGSTYAFSALTFAPAGVLQIHGLCRAEARAALAPRFRRAALSARLR